MSSNSVVSPSICESVSVNDNITINVGSQYLVVHVHVVPVSSVRQVLVIIPNGVSDIPICNDGHILL